MKRYIRTNSSRATTARQLADAVIAELEHIGFEQVKYVPYRGKPGTSGAKVCFTYQYNPVSEQDREYFLNGEYAEKWGADDGKITLESHEAAYNNFMTIQDVTQLNAQEEGFHDPVSHRGGGYSDIDSELLSYVRSYVNNICQDAIVEMHRSGLYGFETNIELLLFVPK